MNQERELPGGIGRAAENAPGKAPMRRPHSTTETSALSISWESALNPPTMARQQATEAKAYREVSHG